MLINGEKYDYNNVIVTIGDVELPAVSSIQYTQKENRLLFSDIISYDGYMELSMDEINRVRALVPEMCPLELTDETKQYISDLVYEKTGDRISGISIDHIEETGLASYCIHLNVDDK